MAERVTVTAGDPGGLAPGDYIRVTVGDTGAGMSAETLARVDELVASGDLAGARARLRDLVLSAPQRLDLLERLAALYRLEGNRAQAGRWGYLAEDRGAGRPLEPTAPRHLGLVMTLRAK